MEPFKKSVTRLLALAFAYLFLSMPIGVQAAGKPSEQLYAWDEIEADLSISKGSSFTTVKCPTLTVSSYDEMVEHAGAYIQTVLLQRFSQICTVSVPICIESGEKVDAIDALGNDDDALDVFYDELADSINAHTGDPDAGDMLFNESYSLSKSLSDLSYSNGRYTMTIKVQTYFLATPERYAKFKTEADSIVESLDLEGKSDYEKCYAITDWIYQNIDFDGDADTDSTGDSEFMQNIGSSALIDKVSNCGGIASVFYYMANSVGLDARFNYCMTHAWNIVGIDGEYYYLDISKMCSAGTLKPSAFLYGSETHNYESVTGLTDMYEISEKSYGETHAVCTEHSYDSGTVTKEATCSEEGIRTYTCKNCGSTYTEAIPKTSHSYESTITREASCKEEGEMTYTCTVYTELIEKTEHAYESSVTKEASCKEEGEMTYRCSICGDTYTEAIEKTTHSYKNTITIEPSCTLEGENTYECTVCGDTYTETIPKTEHSYLGSITKEAACTEDGIRTYTCVNCKDSYTEVIPATGHDYAEGVVTKEASCTQQGEITYTCSICKDTCTEVIPKIGHSYDDGTVTREASCTQTGETTYTCTICKDTYTEAIPETEHSYTSAVAKVATCTEDGIRTYTCENCGDSYMETIKATGHDYDAGTITKEPTYKNEGIITYSCKICGESKSESVDRLTAPAKGTTFKVNKNIYRITKSGASGGTVTFIGTRSKEKTVKIPATVTKDGITYKVTSIAKKAMMGNKRATKVVIGKNVSSIGKKAFYGCANLRIIKIKSMHLVKESVGAKAFKNVESDAVIKVPASKLRKYKRILKASGIGRKVRIVGIS